MIGVLRFRDPDELRPTAEKEPPSTKAWRCIKEKPCDGEV